MSRPQFTEQAWNAIALSTQAASELGHNYVGTEHLLVGLLLEEEGVAARVLDAYKADGVTGVDSYPVVSYTTEEIEERSPIYKDLTTYLQQAKAQFITGELDVDQDWDTYVNTVEQMNASRLLEIEQAAYDRFTAIKE